MVLRHRREPLLASGGGDNLIDGEPFLDPRIRIDPKIDIVSGKVPGQEWTYGQCPERRRLGAQVPVYRQIPIRLDDMRKQRGKHSKGSRRKPEIKQSDVRERWIIPLRKRA